MVGQCEPLSVYWRFRISLKNLNYAVIVPVSLSYSRNYFSGTFYVRDKDIFFFKYVFDASKFEVLSLVEAPPTQFKWKRN